MIIKIVRTSFPKNFPITTTFFFDITTLECLNRCVVFAAYLYSQAARVRRDKYLISLPSSSICFKGQVIKCVYALNNENMSVRV